MIPRITFAAIAALALAACEPIQPGTIGGGGGGVKPPPCLSPNASDAFVQPAGAAVFLNGVRIASACGLSQGDDLRTGDNSTATVRFRDGTTIELAPDTDPTTNWVPPAGAKQGQIHLTLGSSLTLIQSGFQYVVDWVTNEAEGLVFSTVVIESRGGVTRAYLFQGHLHLMRPAPRDLLPGQVATITRGGVVTVGPISPRDQARFSAVFRRQIGTPQPVIGRPAPPVLRPPTVKQPQKPPPPAPIG